MFLCAPFMFAMLTPDPAIRALGARVLRIEAFAEPLFAVSIVAQGALRGAGDTLVPSLMNLASMWGVRILCCWRLVLDWSAYGRRCVRSCACAACCF